MKPVVFHEVANVELLDAVRYYDTKAIGLGLSLLLEIESAVEEIRLHPESCALISALIRHKPLRRFPFSLFYAIEPDRIRILAVGHQRRRPGYWRHRLT
jgi:toxin ParE1/3/4